MKKIFSLKNDSLFKGCHYLKLSGNLPTFVCKPSKHLPVQIQLYKH